VGPVTSPTIYHQLTPPKDLREQAVEEARLQLEADRLALDQQHLLQDQQRAEQQHLKAKQGND